MVGFGLKLADFKFRIILLLLVILLNLINIIAKESKTPPLSNQSLHLFMVA